MSHKEVLECSHSDWCAIQGIQKPLLEMLCRAVSSRIKVEKQSSDRVCVGARELNVHIDSPLPHQRWIQGVAVVGGEHEDPTITVRNAIEGVQDS
eukprot:CAMPEP_0202847156 /NCGR_PEP_ID=MMETSP1389-20130828/74730_1 /ASSEMBLY_ACC=CAM_ASM_000865 /TAXON_ID=302021 /ORGANISM="Rhodomonas sp., Strain CCMP768" /LENGTH=94 /DNA_ID=CAMNT_0049524823 /DNA_START=409 /DNA_END=693 /DNA_ORIENTATION=+